MQIKFSTVLLLSTLTTLVALAVSFVALGDNSGYAGLFFIAISPIFVLVFTVWTFILVSLMKKNTYLDHIALPALMTWIVEYLIIGMTMWIMSSDSPGYDLRTFLTDYGSIFSDKTIYICTITVAVSYTVSLKYIGLARKTLKKVA